MTAALRRCGRPNALAVAATAAARRAPIGFGRVVSRGHSDSIAATQRCAMSDIAVRALASAAPATARPLHPTAARLARIEPLSSEALRAETQATLLTLQQDLDHITALAHQVNHQEEVLAKIVSIILPVKYTPALIQNLKSDSCDTRNSGITLNTLNDCKNNRIGFSVTLKDITATQDSVLQKIDQERAEFQSSLSSFHRGQRVPSFTSTSCVVLEELFKKHGDPKLQLSLRPEPEVLKGIQDLCLASSLIALDVQKLLDKQAAFIHRYRNERSFSAYHPDS